MGRRKSIRNHAIMIGSRKWFRVCHHKARRIGLRWPYFDEGRYEPYRLRPNPRKW